MATRKEEEGREKFDELMNKMSEVKEKWKEEAGSDDEEDDTGKLLDRAIELAIEQGRGWAPGEKEAYLETILDDEFIPPIFANTADEVEKMGLTEAFTSLKYDDSPTQLMLNFKKMGNESFASGKRNEAGNLQYFRDAINHYYESIAWAQKIDPMMPGDLTVADTDDPTYTEEELNEMKSTICANAAMAHMQLKNWGYVRDQAKKALEFNKNNIKAWYRLAKAYQMLQEFEACGDAIDSGLQIKGEEDNKDLRKLQNTLAKKINSARQLRQKRERARAERVANVKKVWKHCSELGIRLGRLPLVASVTDDEDGVDEESRWHHHRPNSGHLPAESGGTGWSWPCMLIYPSHQQSDFIKDFGESEMIAMRMANVFPELESEEENTAMPWDHNNEFTCSNLAVYCEIHCQGGEKELVHPENVALLPDQGSAMKFHEATRALLGDEGDDMANLVRALERKSLYKQRKAWIKKHGSLWAKPEPCPVVRIHPAVSLADVLKDTRIVVPNFLVTLTLFPENHPAHAAFLKERKCVGIIQPEDMS